MRRESGFLLKVFDWGTRKRAFILAISQLRYSSCKIYGTPPPQSLSGSDGGVESLMKNSALKGAAIV